MSNKIKQYLDLASKAYYDGEPIMPDDVFDRLADTIGYNKVGASVQGNTAKHYQRMYSLQKFYQDDGKERPLPNGDISVSVKLDGAAISLLYIDGQLVQALTRGDGVEGQDITDKIKASETLVPKTLVFEQGSNRIAKRVGYVPMPLIVQVTGEIVAPLTIPNARNYAAGALNLKDVNEFCTRTLSFVAHGVFPAPTNTYQDDMQVLESYGFVSCKTLDLEKLYPNDGMVFRVNRNDVFEDMGFTAKHPRGAYALKTRGDHVETVLLDVEWQVGKSGKVTPVAILEPVLVGDAMVSRATLNNPGFIEALGIEIGDRVAVIRAGEIIPCITHKIED